MEIGWEHIMEKVKVIMDGARVKHGSARERNYIYQVYHEHELEVERGWSGQHSCKR